MPDHLGDDMRKVRPEEKEEEIKCKYIRHRSAQTCQNKSDSRLIFGKYLLDKLQLWMKETLNC